MEIFKSYLLQNWALILVLIAFVIVLMITVFLDRSTKIRMYILIGAVFLLSIIVFTEFYLADINKYHDVREVMMAIRYSATPAIISLILFALVKRTKWYVTIPAILLTIINIISIFTGIVFSVDDTGEFKRGVLGYLPYIVVGLYSAALVAMLIYRSNKQVAEIIPIIFLAVAFASGLIFPFVLGRDYSKIFCTTIAISLFVYYVFQILQLTKKDALTGLLNRQAYYAATRTSREISALLSIDMNGLKVINDTGGHHAGDVALETLANCFFKAARSNMQVYRLGGDEFVILCKKVSEGELYALLKRIEKNVSETKYSCSIGYSYNADGNKTIEQMVKESDEMMYQNKAKYYQNKGIDRRGNKYEK